jgi:aminoethylphosphonate catabolism LysR family transcriptional regulator
MRHTELRSFHQVAVTGSFTAAAHALSVSQPTVTAQVKALETAYGVELFLRRHRRVELTPTGRTLLEMTRRLFEQEKEAAEFLAESRGLRRGELRVGAVGPSQVTDMLLAFHRRHPQIAVAVSTGNTEEVVRSLLELRTDVAVMPYDGADQRLAVIAYRRDRIGLLMPKGHPLARRRGALRLADLASQSLVVRECGSHTRRIVESALQRAGVAPRIAMEIGSRELLRAVIAGGIGIGTVSAAEYAPDRRLVLRPFTEALFSDTHVVCLAERRRARLVTAFLDVVAELKAVHTSRRTSKG